MKIAQSLSVIHHGSIENYLRDIIMNILYRILYEYYMNMFNMQREYII